MSDLESNKKASALPSNNRRSSSRESFSAMMSSMRGSIRGSNENDSDNSYSSPSPSPSSKGGRRSVGRGSILSTGSRKSPRRNSGGRRGSFSGRRVTARRFSVHQDMTSHSSVDTTRTIKRQFYGLEVEEKILDKAKSFYEKWHETWLSTIIFFCYFLAGGVFYKYVEGWDSLTCIYFQVVTMTTVGYGDFSPTTTGSRIFTILYIFTGIAIVGRIVNDFAEYVVEYAEKKAEAREKKRKRVEDAVKKGASNSPGGAGADAASGTPFGEGTNTSTPLPTKKKAHATTLQHYSSKIIFSLGSIFLCLFMGAAFYTTNEEWDFTMAFYFCVVTMCTVGYGDTALTKDSSRAFTIFYIMSSCVLVTLAIGNLAGINIQMRSEKKKLRMLNRKLDFNFIRELDTGENGMDRTMFLVAMLVQQELVKKEKDVDPWLAKFDELDTNGDGIIDFDDAIEDLQKEAAVLECGIDESVDGNDILGNLGGFFMRQSIMPAGGAAAAAAGGGGGGGSSRRRSSSSSGGGEAITFTDNPLHGSKV